MMLLLAGKDHPREREVEAVLLDLFLLKTGHTSRKNVRTYRMSLNR